MTKSKTKTKAVAARNKKNPVDSIPAGTPVPDHVKEVKRSFNDPPLNKPLAKTSITVKKVRIESKDFLSVVFSKLESDGSTSDHEETYSKRFMHPDTRSKFKGLCVHFAIINDYLQTEDVKSVKKYDSALVEKFTVSSVHIKPNEGFQLSGHKINAWGKAVNQNTPYMLFEQEEKSSYKFIDDVIEKLEALEQDVIQYLEGTLVGEDPQGKLDFPNQDNE